MALYTPAIACVLDTPGVGRKLGGINIPGATWDVVLEYDNAPR